MTPILSTVIKSDNGTTDAGRIRAYLDDLIESLPALLPYRYALIDVMALKTDSRVEVYEEAGKDGGRILWLPDTPSAKEARERRGPHPMVARYSQRRRRALRWRRMAMDARQQPARCAATIS